MRELIAHFDYPFTEEKIRLIAGVICRKIQHLPIDIDGDNLIAIITKQAGIKDFAQIKSIDVEHDDKVERVEINLTLKDGTKKQGFRGWCSY